MTALPLEGTKLAGLLKDCAACVGRQEFHPVVHEALGELCVYVKHHKSFLPSKKTTSAMTLPSAGTKLEALLAECASYEKREECQKLSSQLITCASYVEVDGWNIYIYKTMEELRLYMKYQNFLNISSMAPKTPTSSEVHQDQVEEVKEDQRDQVDEVKESPFPTMSAKKKGASPTSVFASAFANLDNLFGRGTKTPQQSNASSVDAERENPFGETAERPNLEKKKSSSWHKQSNPFEETGTETPKQSSKLSVGDLCHNPSWFSIDQESQETTPTHTNRTFAEYERQSPFGETVERPKLAKKKSSASSRSADRSLSKSSSWRERSIPLEDILERPNREKKKSSASRSVDRSLSKQKSSSQRERKNPFEETVERPKHEKKKSSTSRSADRFLSKQKSSSRREQRDPVSEGTSKSKSHRSSSKKEKSSTSGDKAKTKSSRKKSYTRESKPKEFGMDYIDV